MPLPIILGVAALGATVFGAQKGYDGYQKHSRADDIVDDAKRRYQHQRDEFDEQETSTHEALSDLGEHELALGKTFDEFSTLAEALLQQLNQHRKKPLQIRLPRHELQKIETFSITAVGVLGTAAGASAAGAAAGFAVYGGVMTRGAASTGTAIASLSGAAATNATLAALGGGSLATGGLGMAGGTMVLGASVAAPVLAIAGWAYDKHGEEALRNARQAADEADSAIEKLALALDKLADTERYAGHILTTLQDMFSLFSPYFETLREIDQQLKRKRQQGQQAAEAFLDALGDDILTSIENGYALASLMVNLMTTPIFKLNTAPSSAPETVESSTPLALDDEGNTLLDRDSLDMAIQTATTGLAEYQA